MVDVSEIANHLRLSSLGEEEINRRAQFVAEDFEKIGFAEFRLSSQVYPFPDFQTRTLVSKPLAEYHFGDTGFSINRAVNPFDDSPTWFGGAGLDRGHLQFFSKVSIIARHVIPEYWLASRQLRSSLRNPTQHLDTLEEIWWLARWKRLKLRGIRMAQKLSPTLAGDVDWQIDLPEMEMTINKEVKRLKFDVIRMRQGRGFDPHRFSVFCDQDVLPKFRPSTDKEVNVLALTIFGEVNAQVNEVLQTWIMGDQGLIDAILVSAHHPLGGGQLFLHFANQKARELQPQLNSLDAEDRGMWFPIEVACEIPGFPLPSRR